MPFNTVVMSVLHSSCSLLREKTESNAMFDSSVCHNNQLRLTNKYGQRNTHFTVAILVILPFLVLFVVNDFQHVPAYLCHATLSLKPFVIPSPDSDLNLFRFAGRFLFFFGYGCRRRFVRVRRGTVVGVVV